MSLLREGFLIAQGWLWGVVLFANRLLGAWFRARYVNIVCAGNSPRLPNVLLS